MDGGAWWAAVHGIAKSRTQLSYFTFTFHCHALEKERPSAWEEPPAPSQTRLLLPLLADLSFPTAMGPVTSCRLLFVGCESVDAAVTPTQEVLQSLHGHTCFQLPFKRMSFFIPGGVSVIEARKV